MEAGTTGIQTFQVLAEKWNPKMTVMDYLAKDEQLEIKHQPGKGAWTYHIELPNTQHLVGKWGSLKASGFIDNYQIEAKNLFTIRGKNKLIAINEDIRKAINKSGGDTVHVTLYLLPTKKKLTAHEILDTFEDGGVLERFTQLARAEQEAVLASITAHKTEEKQIREIIAYIDKLGKAG